MSDYIQDGAGTGNRAKVDVDNRLHVESVSKTPVQQGAIKGGTYNINTGTVNLTSSNESGMLYLKNTSENKNITISLVGYLLGSSTGGSGDFLATIVRNPTGGTLLSGLLPPASNINKNFGSNKVLSAVAYKGVEGSTVAGGVDGYFSLLPGAARSYVINTGDIVLEPKTSLAIKVKPQSGNTSMDLQVFVSILEKVQD